MRVRQGAIVYDDILYYDVWLHSNCKETIKGLLKSEESDHLLVMCVPWLAFQASREGFCFKPVSSLKPVNFCNSFLRNTPFLLASYWFRLVLESVNPNHWWRAVADRRRGREGQSRIGSGGSLRWESGAEGLSPALMWTCRASVRRYLLVNILEMFWESGVWLNMKWLIVRIMDFYTKGIEDQSFHSFVHSFAGHWVLVCSWFCSMLSSFLGFPSEHFSQVIIFFFVFFFYYY